jgi:hypothetical protein
MMGLPSPIQTTNPITIKTGESTSSASAATDRSKIRLDMGIPDELDIKAILPK